MKPMKKGGRKQASPPGQAARNAAPAAKQPTMETAEAIQLLENKIEFLGAAFADNERSMAYRAALILAVAALKREAGIA